KRIEEALRSPEVFPLLPVLAQSCVTLCALEGVDPAEVEGGTFLRNPSTSLFHFLPGLVRTPSEGFEQLCQERLASALKRQRAMIHHLRLDRRHSFELDLQEGKIRFFDEARRPLSEARATLLGSFSDRSRTWAWAWGNATLPPGLQEPSRQLCDQVIRRDLWEISTPQFTTDFGTAQALASLLAVEAGAAGVHAIRQEHHTLLLLLDHLQPAEGAP
ncbi:MAG: hypothetical protein RMJ98_06040, partial [Myxococcales bacterium]|nr:hypothetical protein [Myxococcales bacterium]